MGIQSVYEVLGGTSRTLYDFFIYIGKETCNTYELGFSGDIVIGLCKTYLPKYDKLRIFTNGWFTSLPLLTYLKTNEYGLQEF